MLLIWDDEVLLADHRVHPSRPSWFRPFWFLLKWKNRSSATVVISEKFYDVLVRLAIKYPTGRESVTTMDWSVSWTQQLVNCSDDDDNARRQIDKQRDHKTNVLDKFICTSRQPVRWRLKDKLGGSLQRHAQKYRRLDVRVIWKFNRTMLTKAKDVTRSFEEGIPADRL